MATTKTGSTKTGSTKTGSTKTGSTKTAAVKAAPVAEIKQPTRMSQAKTLFAEVFSKGYNLNGQSQRQVFIARAIAEIGMTNAGANTYFQNISNERKGESLYKYNKNTSKAAEATVEGGLPGERAPTKRQIKAAEATAQASAVDLSKRYQIVNDKGQTVHSFATKAPAERYIAGNAKLSVNDTKKAAKG